MVYKRKKGDTSKPEYQTMPYYPSRDSHPAMEILPNSRPEDADRSAVPMINLNFHTGQRGIPELRNGPMGRRLGKLKGNMSLHEQHVAHEKNVKNNPEKYG